MHEFTKGTTLTDRVLRPHIMGVEMGRSLHRIEQAVARADSGSPGNKLMLCPLNSPSTQMFA